MTALQNFSQVFLVARDQSLNSSFTKELVLRISSKGKLLSLCWISVDLKDTLSITHLGFHKVPPLFCIETVYQFRILCFRLAAAPSGVHENVQFVDILG